VTHSVCTNQNDNNAYIVFYNIFWCAPFGYLHFSYFSIVNQNWVQESILAWLWPHFNIVFWMRRDLNTKPFDRKLRCPNKAYFQAKRYQDVLASFESLGMESSFSLVNIFFCCCHKRRKNELSNSWEMINSYPRGNWKCLEQTKNAKQNLPVVRKKGISL